jgi:hypothetical protein
MATRDLYDISFTLSGEEDEQRQQFVKWISKLERKDFEVGTYKDEEFHAMDPEELFDQGEVDDSMDRSMVFVAAKVFETDDDDKIEELRESSLSWLEEVDPENGWEVDWAGEEYID